MYIGGTNGQGGRTVTTTIVYLYLHKESHDGPYRCFLEGFLYIR